MMWGPHRPQTVVTSQSSLREANGIPSSRWWQCTVEDGRLDIPATSFLYTEEIYKSSCMSSPSHAVIYCRCCWATDVGQQIELWRAA
jgi:hypothetical protein